MIKERKRNKENWMEKLRKHGNQSATIDAKELMGRNSGTNLTQDTSMYSLSKTLPPNINFQSNATLALSALGGNNASFSDLNAVFSQLLSKNNQSSGAQSEQKLTLPEISKSYQSNLVNGKNLDNIYTRKNEELGKLKDEVKELKTENNQFKKLNEKLLDRVDFQQSIIEKEASAHTYMYNYPPKGEAQAAAGAKTGKAGAADNEGNRVKKMYEDMMES